MPMAPGSGAFFDVVDPGQGAFPGAHLGGIAIDLRLETLVALGLGARNVKGGLDFGPAGARLGQGILEPLVMLLVHKDAVGVMFQPLGKGQRPRVIGRVVAIVAGLEGRTAGILRQIGRLGATLARGLCPFVAGQMRTFG